MVGLSCGELHGYATGAIMAKDVGALLTRAAARRIKAARQSPAVKEAGAGVGQLLSSAGRALVGGGRLASQGMRGAKAFGEQAGNMLGAGVSAIGQRAGNLPGAARLGQLNTAAKGAVGGPSFRAAGGGGWGTAAINGVGMPDGGIRAAVGGAKNLAARGVAGVQTNPAAAFGAGAATAAGAHALVGSGDASQQLRNPPPGVGRPDVGTGAPFRPQTPEQQQLHQFIRRQMRNPPAGLGEEMRKRQFEGMGTGMSWRMPGRAGTPATAPSFKYSPSGQMLPGGMDDKEAASFGPLAGKLVGAVSGGAKKLFDGAATRAKTLGTRINDNAKGVVGGPLFRGEAQGAGAPNPGMNTWGNAVETGIPTHTFRAALATEGALAAGQRGLSGAKNMAGRGLAAAKQNPALTASAALGAGGVGLGAYGVMSSGKPPAPSMAVAGGPAVTTPTPAGTDMGGGDTAPAGAPAAAPLAKTPATGAPPAPGGAPTAPDAPAKPGLGETFSGWGKQLGDFASQIPEHLSNGWQALSAHMGQHWPKWLAGGAGVLGIHHLIKQLFGNRDREESGSLYKVAANNTLVRQLSEAFPCEMGFLKCCADRGWSEQQVILGVIKSASLDPAIEAGWQRFCATWPQGNAR